MRSANLRVGAEDLLYFSQTVVAVSSLFSEPLFWSSGLGLGPDDQGSWKRRNALQGPFEAGEVSRGVMDLLQERHGFF